MPAPTAWAEPFCNYFNNPIQVQKKEMDGVFPPSDAPGHSLKYRRQGSLAPVAAQ